MRFGPMEIILIVVVIIILFGARRIPELMKGLGTGIKEFKTGLKEQSEGIDNDPKDESEKKSD